jgi:hypothetical protein
MAKQELGEPLSRSGKYFMLVMIVLLISLACVAFNVSAGMTFRVVTDKPVEDIVVRCVKSVPYLISHNASSKAVVYDTMVVDSNKNFSCGLVISGKPSRLEVQHPTYVFHEEKKGEEVDKIISMVPATDKLELLERKYLDGYWQKRRDPLEGFIYSVKYVCQFSGDSVKDYLESYAQGARPGYRALKKKYYVGVKECLEKQEELRHKYNSSPARSFVSKFLYPCDNLDRGRCKEEGNEYRPEIRIKKMLDYAWGEKMWGPYFLNEEDKNRAFGGKKTYLAVYNDPDVKGGTWMLIDAWSKADINKKYPGLVVYDDKPSWMSESQKQRFTSCNGENLHWDIDEPGGWLLDYENGIVKDLFCYR